MLIDQETVPLGRDDGKKKENEQALLESFWTSVCRRFSLFISYL